ncbi:MAG: type II and III secretion system protein [Ignavibacteriaceae bacterium]|nr:type II and III secretion system protein [Ignavibacteriaceae bacterium]
MKLKLIFVVVFLLGTTCFPQKYLERQLQGNIPKDQIVTLSPNLTFQQAVDLLSKVSEKAKGKKIVSTIQVNEPIGIELANVAYDKALVALVQMMGLIYEEKEDVIIIKRKNETAPVQRTESTYASVDSREVKISAVFFEADLNTERQLGVDWQVLLSRNGLNLGGNGGNPIQSTTTTGSGTSGTTTTATQGYQLNATTNFNLGGFFGDATAIFRAFETQSIGEIIASPNITTRDRVKGRIQVGTDFSIKQKDFAGNVIENFFSTGSIVEVTPYVYKEDGVDYILLNINVEKSSFTPDPTTTEVIKSSANSQVVLLNGEETIIGGLYENNLTKIRNGIPFLKDLPWWFFGLRYIFGSDDIITTKKELVISIKAELIPSLKERLSGIHSSNPIKDELNSHKDKIKIYQFNESQQTPTKDK